MTHFIDHFSSCPVLREESEASMKELRLALEEERAAERQRLDAQRREDVERLKAELEEELRAERRRLQGEREEKLNALKQEVIPNHTVKFKFKIQIIRRKKKQKSVVVVVFLEGTVRSGSTDSTSL